MNCIRVATEEELGEVLEIRRKVFVEEQGVPADLEWDEFDASPDSCRHFLVRDGRSPVAAGRWRPYEEGLAKFQRIAVLAPWRGKSVGRLLMNEMERDARERGCSGVVLDAQRTAEPFYRKLGYRAQTGETFLDAGIPHVRMDKIWD
ncbi:GNAT family N-acetyltransferase [Cohnella zeiphila]|uniref:GNAT family N-acetyltransferase n=1 Tax=Cohnella zeiphila TaxID=2761120 RepID=A0A7X0SI41_9BACL|nr:GNAT family N-acetyltransferase [Cohnella zeiphila]MBB6730367.1 GNAT family N-acetyltransferase [Cohnella zeiphila]